MTDKRDFKSILDYKPKLENIIETLLTDIEFSYSAILSNNTIQTYFNMLALEYYGFEYFQILKLNNLKLKATEKSLNLTVLEMTYNIVNQIIARKWKYSEYIAYDIYILPIRIKKYISAVNYKFIETETAQKQPILKLVASSTRGIVSELDDSHHDDQLHSIIIKFRYTDEQDYKTKLNLFKNLWVFIEETRGLAYQQFGEHFSSRYFELAEKLNNLRTLDLEKKDIKLIKEKIEDVFNIGLLIILLMEDSVKKGIWDRIKQTELLRVELENNEKTIEIASQKILELRELEQKNRVLAERKSKKYK